MIRCDSSNADSLNGSMEATISIDLFEWTLTRVPIGILMLFIAILAIPSHSLAKDPVTASINQKAVWVGQPVSLTVVLYSQGPFSGTASFDLPEMPRTTFVKDGNPVVGSKELDGESFFTQSHEFKVFTQQTGDVVIPSFQVRFEGSTSPNNDTERISGKTTQLRFKSKKQPGTQGLGLVPAVQRMSITQSWQPLETGTLYAGDIIERTVIRNATGTTAMMLPKLPADAPPGTRIYFADPIVKDKTQRGQSSSQRTDKIKYQFEAAGEFELPPFEFYWWDYQSEKLERETVPGLSIVVKELPVHDQIASNNELSPESESFIRRITDSIGALFLIAAPLMPGFISFLIAISILMFVRYRWKKHLAVPEIALARQVIQACKANDSMATYRALLSWQRIAFTASAHDHVDLDQSLSREIDLLKAHCFARKIKDQSWNGLTLLKAFSKFRKKLSQNMATEKKSELPPLNPT